MIPVRVSLFCRISLPILAVFPRAAWFLAARLSRNSGSSASSPAISSSSTTSFFAPSWPSHTSTDGARFRRTAKPGSRALRVQCQCGRAVPPRSPAQCRRCFAPNAQQQTFARIRPAPPDLIFQRFNLRLKETENVRGFRLIRALIDRAESDPRAQSVGVAACNTYPPSRALHRGTVPARSIGHPLLSLAKRDNVSISLLLCFVLDSSILRPMTRSRCLLFSRFDSFFFAIRTPLTRSRFFVIHTY